MADVQGYTVLVVSTTDGKIVSELQPVDQPTWLRQINDPGTWQVKVQLGDLGNPSTERLRALVAPGRFCIAIVWGTWVAQAGPIVSYGIDDTSGTLTMTGPGLWGLFNRRLLTHPNWLPAPWTPISDTSADTNLTGTLPDIALSLVRNAVHMLYRPGSGLPVDIPANAGGGSNTRFYPGYDLVSVGQRLQELTQVENGPDVEFAPYLKGDGTLRWNLMVGNPYLIQPGSDVVFDYGSSLQSLSIDGDGSNLATSAFVKGSGNERTQLSAYATSTTLTDAGWPMIDYVDSSHSSATEQATLNGWAKADLALYGKATEQWHGIVRANSEPRLGTYWPGSFGKYNVIGHPWILDGQYQVRILGLANGRSAGEVTHVLEGRGGF